MTNEEATGILRHAADRRLLVHVNGTAHEMEPDEMDEALRLAITALERDRWISVEERLPEEYELVLVCFPIDEETTQYGFDVWLGCRWQDYKAQWWMPLPEPPKEEET